MKIACDDYDAVFEDLSSFCDMSGEESRARVAMDVVREASSPGSSSG